MIPRNDRIVTVVATTGQEYVGKLVNDSNGVLLERPKMIVFSENQMGFAQGICATGTSEVQDVQFYPAGIAFVTEPDESVVNAYWQAEQARIEEENPEPSKIYAPESKIIV